MNTLTCAEDALQFIDEYYAITSTGKVGAVLLRELKRYPVPQLGEILEQLTATLHPRFNPAASDVRTAAAAVGVPPIPKGKKAPVDPDELEAWHYGRGGRIQRLAEKVATDDDATNVTALRLSREAGFQQEPWRRPAFKRGREPHWKKLPPDAAGVLRSILMIPVVAHEAKGGKHGERLREIVEHIIGTHMENGPDFMRIEEQQEYERLLGDDLVQIPAGVPSVFDAVARSKRMSR